MRWRTMNRRRRSVALRRARNTTRLVELVMPNLIPELLTRMFGPPVENDAALRHRVRIARNAPEIERLIKRGALKR